MPASDAFDYFIKQMELLIEQVAAEGRENEDLEAENERLRVQTTVLLEEGASNATAKCAPHFGAADRTLARCCEPL